MADAQKFSHQLFEGADKLYDAGRRSGVPVSLGLFDKRILFPLSSSAAGAETCLSDAVERETGEVLSEDDLRLKATQGWFPLLTRDWDGTEGAPMYVPSRIGLLLRLQRDGYATEELELIARLEEWSIDNLLTTEELQYVDDDLDALILHVESWLIAVDQGVTRDARGNLVDQTAEISAARRDLERLQELRANGGIIPDHKRDAFDRRVFRGRFVSEFIRLQLLDGDRAKIRAGYSPLIVAGGSRHDFATGQVTVDSILWDMTVRSAIAYGEGVPAPLRVPGFFLHGDRVVSSKTLRPPQFESLWKQHELDKYLEAWAAASGERCCLSCLTPLDGSEKKKFCSDKCRNTAKQRRYRERHPEAAARAQQRYWQSLKS
jgi:hypothetical protein